MYEGLGNNIATTVLAAVTTLFCFAPIVFLRYGRKLREKSQWAVKGEEAMRDENRHLVQESGRTEEGSGPDGEGKEKHITRSAALRKE